MSLSVFEVLFLVDGPGMSLAEGIICPQASQTCCDTPPPFEKDIPSLNFLFSFRGGGSEVGVNGKKYILRGSSSK